MKYFKITHKTKSKFESMFMPIDNLKNLKFDHKSKYLEIEMVGIFESGHTKAFNLMNLEAFLASKNEGIFHIEFCESEEEAS